MVHEDIPIEAIEAIEHGEHGRACAMAAAVVVIKACRRLRIFPCFGHDVLFQKIRTERFGDQPDDVVFTAVRIPFDVVSRIFQGGFFAVCVREGGNLLAVGFFEAEPTEHGTHAHGDDIGQGILLGKNLRIREEIGMACAEQGVGGGDGPDAAYCRHDGWTADFPADGVHFCDMEA